MILLFRISYGKFAVSQQITVNRDGLMGYGLRYQATTGMSLNACLIDGTLRSEVFRKCDLSININLVDIKIGKV